MRNESKPRRSKIKKGDQVIVVSGSHKTKRGRVLEVLPSQGKIKVEGVALAKRHMKARANQGAGIVEKEAYLDISNVQLIDPDSGKPTRVKYQSNADGSKSRIAVRSGRVLE
jgi:large subunit ribosomal protein L24